MHHCEIDTALSKTGRSKNARRRYIATFGQIPKRWHIHHICENPACCRLTHLRAVSPAIHQELHHGHGGISHGVAPAHQINRDIRINALKQRVARAQRPKKEVLAPAPTRSDPYAFRSRWA